MRHLLYFLAAVIVICYSRNARSVDWFAATPFEYRGFGYFRLLHSFRDSVSTEGVSSNSAFGGQLQLDTASHGYVYRPWIAQFDILASIHTNTNQFSLETLEEQSMNQAKLDFGLNLFEQRSYPTYISAKKRRDFLSGSIDAINDTQDIEIRSRLLADSKISQSNFYFRDKKEVSSLDDREHSIKTFNFNWRTNQSKNVWDVNVALEDQSLFLAPAVGQIQNNSDTSSILSLSHNWTPNSFNSVSSLYTFSDTQLANNNFEQNQQRQQLTTFAVLRSEDDPRFRYTLNLIADAFDSESLLGATIPDVSSENAIANAGFFFDISDYWTFSTNLSATNTKQGLARESTLNYFSGLVYSNDWQVSERSNYSLSLDNRFVQHDFKTRNEKDSLFTSIVDHAISWDKSLESSSLILTFGQQITDQAGDVLEDSRLSKNLTHRVSMNWFSREQNNDTFVQMELSDSRHWDQNPELFQQLNLQVSRRQSISELRGWNANLSAQWTRNLTPELEESEEQSITGSLGYRDRQLWGVANLSLQSNLTFPIDKVLFNNGRRNNDLTNWRTEVLYRYGLVEVRSELILTDKSKYFKIEARRGFSF